MKNLIIVTIIGMLILTGCQCDKDSSYSTDPNTSKESVLPKSDNILEESSTESSLTNAALDLVKDNVCNANIYDSLMMYDNVEFNDVEYFCIVAGSETQEKFTAEQIYYVEKNLSKIYEYNVIDDSINEIWKAK